MPHTHKFKTALHILQARGVKGVIQTVHSKMNHAYCPNETQILYQLLSENGQTGLMVDVGAAQGDSLSPFAKSGWRIIAFEPEATNRGILSERFAAHTNVTIDPRACSDIPHPEATLYTSKVSTGVSSLSPFLNTHIPAQQVCVTTLSEAFLDHGLFEQKIDFLKIDTEGYDLMVLKGYPWSACNPPDVILCEFEDTKTIPLGYCLNDMVDFLLSKAYHLIISEWYPIKSYGGPHHWRCFAIYPYTLKDTKGWGNIIAVRDGNVYDELCRSFHLDIN